jgi:L-ribulose-5-phosphate 3-epimerase
MSPTLNRRGFLAGTAAAATTLAVARAKDTPPEARLRKALIGTPSEATLRSWKEAGFDGMESTDRGASPEKAAAAREIAEKLGMRIHSVLFGWANFNDPARAEADLAAVETALRACQGYGADALLLVPCKIGGMAVPEAWEFDLRFDDKTGHLRQVVAGDNSKFARYIEAHNLATDASRQAVSHLIPAAEKARVVIALENVWNNLWVRPAFFANFVASFKSPWVRAYFDIGNHVKYAPPEEWIRALDKLIAKCHVKDFKLNADGHGGRFCAIREGSVNWPAVRVALKKAGYNGWMTIEGGEIPSLAEENRRLDLIIAGK